ncbi:iron uptake porin [Chroococcus sp. FPU101]|uniref:iron uptake porin n=1 Tax=Chroococcus sp. FPU101 TaxID=1974212 RepID=UPI001A902706|nr:iron uptake porin [Chroococcus sp. FPU101]GFE68669.1 carbohydrate-selective porin OprB [Chroococcus sp. FPU101]
MFKLTWKSLLISPTLLGIALAVASPAQADDMLNVIEESQTGLTNSNTTEVQPTSDPVVNQLEDYSTEGSLGSLDQVTSVNQLRDVEPTAWAFEALRSLVERYGCIVGYPDRTFRGNRALTRWEFAAGLNACMNVMERLIQDGVSVLREDIDKLKRLMEEFQAELAALGARVDNLEARTSFLEDHQFSTTTKLGGEVIFALTDVFGESDQSVQTAFQSRVRLAFNTSFTGKDRLVTRLAAGSGDRFRLNYQSVGFDNEGGAARVDFNNVASPTLTQTFNLAPSTDNNVAVDWLAYYTPLGPVNLYVAAWGGIPSDFLPTTNPFFEDYDGGNGALSTFASESPIFRIGAGTGGSISLPIGGGILGPNAAISAGYLAPNANDPREGAGLYNGDYAAYGQLNFNLFDRLALGATYVHSYHGTDSAIYGNVVGTELSNFATADLNSSLSSPIPDDDYIEGLIPFDFRQKVVNSYGIQAALKLTDWLSISGFGMYSNVTLLGRGNADVWSYGAGVSFPDLFKSGNILGIFAGVPPYVAGLDSRGTPVKFRYDAPIHVEVFYKYQVTDNISLTPGVIWIKNPSQARFLGENQDVFIGTLRGTFTF